MHFNSMKIPQLALLTAAALILAGSNTVRGQSIYVPNADFGSPVVPYEDIALPEMISWEPVETPLQQSNYEIGVFVNNPAYTNDVPDDYIYNCDGTQAAYIFSDYGLAILQDYDSVDSTGGPPSHAFNATYDVGKSYQLRAGLIASADFGQLPGVIMQMSLYYRDSSSNMVTIASSNVVFTTNVFTSITNFVTFELDTPPVQTGDAWAGQHIGIQFLSVIPENLTNGGYWDLGNVQLAATPALINPMWSNGHFGATLLSQPGLVFQILTTTNLSAPLYLWSNVITVTNTSGTTSFVDPSPSYNQRFYQARQVLPPRS
jgi:hypothetical protein